MTTSHYRTRSRRVPRSYDPVALPALLTLLAPWAFVFVLLLKLFEVI